MTISELPPITNLLVSREQRVGRVSEWLNGLDLLTSQVSGEIKDKIVQAKDFIGSHGQVVTPITSPDGNQWGLSRHDSVAERSVGILALFRSDSALHGMFKNQLDKITYYENSQTIFLPPRRTSPLWRGVLSFHEITHAQNHSNGTYRGVENGHWEEEYDVFRDEISVLKQLYGSGYDSVVEATADQYVDDLNQGGFNSVPRPDVMSQSSLETIMGPAYSRMERGLRFGATNMDAIYRAFDRLGRSDHPDVTQWLYDKH